MYTIKQMSADSKRTLQNYRLKKFFNSFLGKTFVILTLPIYVLFRAKPNKSILIVLTPVLTGIYA